MYADAIEGFSKMFLSILLIHDWKLQPFESLVSQANIASGQSHLAVPSKNGWRTRKIN